jgi:hypothetical protein
MGVGDSKDEALDSEERRRSNALAEEVPSFFLKSEYTSNTEELSDEDTESACLALELLQIERSMSS